MGTEQDSRGSSGQPETASTSQKCIWTNHHFPPTPDGKKPGLEGRAQGGSARLLESDPTELGSEVSLSSCKDGCENLNLNHSFLSSVFQDAALSFHMYFPQVP